ncbi:hypothetical protein G9C85_03510 [Halorubellus sp. JP-L1]|uniref:hypothetical protein n=1 Tax=Halorubellus sp. JP-L1 TaxID=2715753 RepID=UPI0014082B3C|nr:hypothetical protein [Halorubellus sp. JP-L1]NHN40703.1 hypothetical protein [Halorubellus sp. JP-L1]
MPGDETTTGEEEPTAEEHAAAEVVDDEAVDGEAVDGEAGDDGFPVSRRKALVGGVGLFVGAGVGATATFATSGDDEVRKVEPNSDGKGTLGELRWILEEKHALAVTSMVRDDDTVRLAYESAASSSSESRREIGAVISAYGLIVANDGPTKTLSADIARAFEDQATNYHVQATWVKKWRSGDLSNAGVAQRVFNTRTFPEGAGPG